MECRWDEVAYGGILRRFYSVKFAGNAPRKGKTGKIYIARNHVTSPLRYRKTYCN
jgi:hypothetical protein